MVRFSSHTWTSALQERLTRESQSGAVGLADATGAEAAIPSPPRVWAEPQLTFGSYSVSPLRGLHFDCADDPVVA